MGSDVAGLSCVEGREASPALSHARGNINEGNSAILSCQGMTIKEPKKPQLNTIDNSQIIPSIISTLSL